MDPADTQSLRERTAQRALALLAVLASLLTLACQGPTPATAAGPAERGDAATEASSGHVHDAGGHAAHRVADPGERALSADAPAEGSMYVLPGTWTDQTGASLELSDLAGRPRVLALVYTSCSYACPAIVAQLKAIEAAFPDPDRSPGLVLVSIDPDRDTPERLAAFARATRLDPSRWTLLNGTDDQVLELSVLLGVKYRATGDGDFAHSNLLTVLDAQGRVIERVEGLTSPVAPAVEALQIRGW